MKVLKIDISLLKESLGTVKVRAVKGYMAGHVYSDKRQRGNLGKSGHEYEEDVKEPSKKTPVRISKAFKKPT